MATVRRPEGISVPVAQTPSGDPGRAAHDLARLADKLCRALGKADGSLAGRVRLQFGIVGRVLPQLVRVAPRVLGDPHAALGDRRAVRDLCAAIGAQPGSALAHLGRGLEAAVATAEARALAALPPDAGPRNQEVLAYFAAAAMRPEVREDARARLATLRQGAAGDGAARAGAPALALPAPREAKKIATGTLAAPKALPETQRLQILAALRRSGHSEVFLRTLAEHMAPDAFGRADLRVSVLIADGHTLVYTNAQGEGAYGRFHVAWDVGEQRMVAIKALHMRSGKFSWDDVQVVKPPKVIPTAPSVLQSELEIMAQVGSSLAVGKVLTRDDKVYLVAPLYEGDLVALRKGLHGDKRAAVMLSATRQIAEQLARCHAEGYVHRDLKSENVLFDGAGNFVLADYGLARRVDPLTQKVAGTAGTVDLLAPEVFVDGAAGPPADVFALGLTCMEEVINRPVFRTPARPEAAESRVEFAAEHRLLPRADGLIDFARLGRHGLAGKVARLARLGVPAATFVVDRMLHPDPRRRATAAEVAAFFAAEHAPDLSDRGARAAVEAALRRPAFERTRALRAAVTQTYANLFVAAGPTARERQS